jgi:DnaK suppressor protein
VPRYDRVEFEPLLLARRDELRAAIGLTEGELDGILAARADATADDEHDPEGSTLSGDWSRLVGLREGAVASYGRCANCGRDIPLARLRVRPAAELCVACAT